MGCPEVVRSRGFLRTTHPSGTCGCHRLRLRRRAGRNVLDWREAYQALSAGRTLSRSVRLGAHEGLILVYRESSPNGAVNWDLTLHSLIHPKAVAREVRVLEVRTTPC